MKYFQKTSFILLTFVSTFVAAIQTKAAPPSSLPGQTLAQREGLENVLEPEKVQSSKDLIQKLPPPTELSPSNDSKLSSIAITHKTDADDFELSPRRPHLLLGFGYVHSKWHKFSGTLKDGSLILDIGFEREWTSHFEGGLHISSIETTSNSVKTENIYAYLISFNTRYHIWPGKIKTFIGMGIGFGAYRVWTLASESTSTISYTKLGSGNMIGFLPEIGMRFAGFGRAFFDLSLGYTGFVDNPKWRMGGANLVLRVGF